MIEICRMGYQMKGHQILKLSMYNSNGFCKKNPFDPTCLKKERKKEKRKKERKKERKKKIKKERKEDT